MSKKFLSLLLALGMTLSLAAPAMAAEEEASAAPEVYTVAEEAEGAVVILHSNDVHGAIEGYAKMAALKAMFQAAGAHVLVVDGGDFSQGATYVSNSQGATAVELMGMVGYDVSALGNHDYDYGYENIKALSGTAAFPMLAANVTYAGESAFDSHVVLTTDSGVKVGFFGLTTPETASKLHPAKMGAMRFAGGEELYAIAQAQVEALQAEGADYIVCLGHLGIYAETAASGNRSVDLLEKVEGIDVFIDGHSHSDLAELEEELGAQRTVNGTVVTSTGTKFANVGVVMIKDGEITTTCVDTKTIPVDEADPVLLRAKAIEDEIMADYGAPFAKSEVELNGAKAPNGNRDGETNNGDLIADAMLWYATKEELGVPAENVVAVTNGGGIRAAIKVGDVSKNDINAVLPFGNTVAVAYVSGAVLLEVLEASTFCTPDPLGGFPQVSGMTFTIDTRKDFDRGEQYGETTYSAPASINRVTINSINGKDFDPEATYAVVTNDFVAAGGDTYYALSVSETITDTGTPLDEAVMAYITEVLDGVISAEKYGEPQGRITVLAYPADLDENEWWYAAAKEAIDCGIMKGTDKGFEALAEITEATVYQALFNGANTGAETEADGNWYDAALAWAAENGLYEGDAESFQDGVILRGKTVDILNAFCQLRGVDGSGLMVGNENGDMMAEKALTRAELAQILVRLAAVPMPLAD